MRMPFVILCASLTLASALAQNRPAVRPGSASVQFMITQQMKQELRELGYTESDISSLSPERARAILDNQITRPQQGMPSSWARKSGRRKGLFSKLVDGTRQVALAGLATALALHFSGLDLGEFSRRVDWAVHELMESTSPRGGRRL